MRLIHGLKLFFICILLFGFACQEVTVDREAEKAAVRQVVENFYAIYVNKDLESLPTVVAQDSDMVNFGTDLVEYWVGYDALESAFKKQAVAFENPQMTFNNLTIHLSTCATVAWYALQIDFEVIYQGQTVFWNGARTTGVLEKRDGKWLIVQFHNSMPVVERAASY
ncbi:nuclear transport factor 2 family protein [candidate division KSB1 bacterium]|nr:nuclear transport factor 2 family protein [candidate division KSB1 bacterium]